jgi:hypothetical protein
VLALLWRTLSSSPLRVVSAVAGGCPGMYVRLVGFSAGKVAMVIDL